MAVAMVSTVVSAPADSMVSVSSLASSWLISPRSAARYICMPRLSGAMFSRLHAALAHSNRGSAPCMASSNSAFIGPMVAQTAWPKALMFSRPHSGRPITSGRTWWTKGAVMLRTASTGSPERSISRATCSAATVLKWSAMVFRARGDRAVPMMARMRVCLGGSSVSRISGRTELGSCQGREVLEKVSQSRRPSDTCSQRPRMAMSSRFSQTTGDSSRRRSSTARAFSTDSALNTSSSMAGMWPGMVSVPWAPGNRLIC